MNQPAADKPVFIDQMPEYQQAVRSIEALSADENAFRSVVDRFGLTEELKKTETDYARLMPQAEVMSGVQRTLHDRSTKTVISQAKNGIVGGSVLGLAGGVAAGYAGVKRWGGIKGTIVGLAAAGAAWVAGAAVAAGLTGRKERAAIRREYNQLVKQEQQLVQQSIALHEDFKARMAAKMLSEQVELVGQGADAKLVSTAASSAAEPSSPPQGAMAAKYAPQPASSKVQSLAQSEGQSMAQRQ
jgi:hypothetical protein